MDPHVSFSKDGPPGSHPQAAEQNALRVQAAAVAAQQAALDEREHALEQRAEKLQAQEGRLREREKTLRDQRLRQTSDAIVARHKLKDAWDELRRARHRWMQRRGNERAALRVRADELEAAASQLERVRKQLRIEQESWRAAREALEVEIDGLNQRAIHERHVLAKLENVTRPLEQKAQPPGEAPHIGQVANVPDEQAVAIAELEALAGAIADQRLLVIEAWERLARLHGDWQQEQRQVASELEALGAQLLARDLCVQGREQVCTQTEAALRQRHEQWLRDHRQIVAARARLRADGEAWQRDQSRLVAECRHKQAVAERSSTALAELRRRWLRRRKQEVQQLRSERETLESFRKEFAKLRQELSTRAAQLEQDQRILIEKTLAVEQLRLEATTSAPDPEQAEHRLDLLRRRWIMHHAAAIRALRRQRSALQRELQTVEARYEALQNRSLTLEAAETALADKQTGWEHRQIGIDARHSRLEYELERAQMERSSAEQHAAALREEVEGIARVLLDEPEPPQQAPLAAA